MTAPVTLPPAVNLISEFPEAYDQGNFGSCTGNAAAGAIQYAQRKQGLVDFTPSRMWLYMQGRILEGDVNQDNGAQIRDVITAFAKLGAPPETEWPYDAAHFAATPPAQDYTNALLDRALQYQRLNGTNLTQLKTCLVAGHPFVFGFTVYDAFEDADVASSGVLQMPLPGEGIVGGHAVLAVGYDDKSQRFTVRNSWGSAWGTNGYFTMPYAYMTNANLADDFWTISLVGAA